MMKDLFELLHQHDVGLATEQDTDGNIYVTVKDQRNYPDGVGIPCCSLGFGEEDWDRPLEKLISEYFIPAIAGIDLIREKIAAGEPSSYI